jgi:hypothetical protein
MTRSCPFCGGRAEIVIGQDSEPDVGPGWTRYYSLRCQKCYASSESVAGVGDQDADAKRRAKELWDRREPCRCGC